MKLKILSMLLFASVAMPASATVSLSLQMGTCFNSSSVAIPDGALWALVGDTNASSTFMGTFATSSSLSAVQANSIFTTGQALSIGTVIGGDTILAMGGFNGVSTTLGLGTYSDVVSLTIGVNGVVAGQNFAFVWFPGATYAPGVNHVGTQVGGINSLLDETSSAGTSAMVVGADGSLTSPGAANSDLGGSLPNSRFTAVNLVPEPSAALLGALGALGLLRRRRI